MGVVWWYVIAVIAGVLQALSIVFSLDFFYIAVFGHLGFILLLFFSVQQVKEIWLLIGITSFVCISTLITLDIQGVLSSLPKIGGDKVVVVSPRELLFQTDKTESWVSSMYIIQKTGASGKRLTTNNTSVLLTLKKKGLESQNSYKNQILRVNKGRFTHLKGQNIRLSGFDIYKLSKGLIVSLRALDTTIIGVEEEGYLANKINSINEYLSQLKWGNRGDTNAFFKSVLWAKKQMLPKDTKRLFKELGLSHLLIVSGFHVGLIFLIVRVFFFALKPLVQWQLIFALLQVFILCFYAFAICGGSPSVTRAVIMASIGIIAYARDRDVNGYHLLGVASLLILISRPLWLLDVGFLLSFTAVMGILIALELSEMYIKSSNKILKFTWSNIVVTIGAQLFTLPIVLGSFGEWYSIGLLSSVLLGIVFSILIGLGLVTIPFLSIARLQEWLYIFLDFCYYHIVSFCQWLHGVTFLDVKGHIEVWQVVVLFFILALVYILKKKPGFLIISICSYFVILVLFLL